MIIRDYGYGNAPSSSFSMNMRPSVLQREMNRGLRRFYLRKLREDVKELNLREFYYKATHLPLYLKIAKHWDAYVSWLEEVEQGLYDKDDHLIEENCLRKAFFLPTLSKGGRQKCRRTSSISVQNSFHRPGRACRPVTVSGILCPERQMAEGPVV
jgi:hypothetical protein